MSQKFKLKNYMEDCVFHYLNEVLANIPGICTCEACKMDIVALALNSLPPKYTVTTMGEVYTKLVVDLEQQVITDVYSAIAKAALIVANNPSHKVKDFIR